MRSCIGPNYLEIYNDQKKLAGGCIDGYFFTSTRDADVFQLLEWVIMRNHAFAEVDDILTRNLMKVKSLSSKQLRKYVLSMTPLVEQTVKQHLPKKFCILFDGLSDSGFHYVALFSIYVKDNAYCETLLACNPLLDEGDLGAEQHLSFLEATLEVFDKTFANVVCLIGDNCSVNQKLSSISLLPVCLLYTSPSPRDQRGSRMPSSA